MGDAVLSTVEDRINVNKNENCESVEPNAVNHESEKISKISQADECEATTSDVLIPTAIVKPKYQKLAFDDRQLPINGTTDDDSTWYDTPQASTITTTPRKVQKHLPNFDRRSQKSFAKQTRKVVNKSESELSMSEKEAINALKNYEKDIDCSVIINNCNFNINNTHKNCCVNNSVAIVQPLKKQDMDLNTFDKNLNSLNIDSCKNNNNSNLLIKHENKLKNINKLNNCNSHNNNFNSSNYGNNLNIASENKRLQRDLNFDSKKSNINIANEKKMEKNDSKENSGECDLIFVLYRIRTGHRVVKNISFVQHGYPGR